MKKDIFRKTEFYSCVRTGGEIKAFKRKGYTDGEYNYYNDNDNWYAIDYYTGLSICDGITLDKCYQSVHSEYFQILLEKAKNSEAYTKRCSDWNKALIKVGAIMENPISS